MTTTATEPITPNWTSEPLQSTESGSPKATDLNQRLARLEVADIEPDIVPFLAAAAAELALLADIPWRFSADDPPVALLRMIARATMARPQASGPHVARLVDRLG